MDGATGERARPFVGRTAELAELRAALLEAVAGRGRLYLIAGEPGIGKTRACQEVAALAPDLGMRALLGSCTDGEGAPAYWPWTQVLGACVGGATSRRRMRETLRRHPTVSPLLGGASVPGPDAATPEQARFRFFNDVTSVLTAAARMQPLLIVLDDLHWADTPTLRLLRFLARALHDARILVVGTYRQTELPRDHPLTDLAELGVGERIELGGLREAEVARFLELSAGRPMPNALVSAVYGQTEGNPFFVGELVRFLALHERSVDPPRADAPLAVPHSVRDVIRGRLRALQPECREVLTIASAIGREFDVAALQPAVERPLDTLMGMLEHAASAGVVEASRGAPGRYAFCHSLIRRVLYDEITPLRRIEIHRRLGEILETLYGPGREEHLAELAHHFFEAALGGDAEKAIDYATRAATQALARVAYEEAAAQYERALQALELRQPDDQRRCRLLVALGDARMQAGETAVAKRTLRQAAELARNIGAGELLARAALAFGWWVEPGKTDHYLVDVLEEAVRVLGDGDSALRARVLAHLAAELWYSGTPERRAALSLEAVEMARRVGDRRALTFALSSRHLALWGPENVEERLAVAGEVVRLATEIEDTERVLQGRVWQVVDFLELGDIQAVDVGIALCGRLADELRQPGYLWWTAVFRGMRALLDGRFAAAETLIHDAFAIGQRAQTENATQVFATQMFLLRREQGRLAELEPAFKGMVEQYPDIPSWRCGLAMLYTQVNRLEEAHKEFERLARHDFTDLPRDLFWLIGIVLLADVCCSLEDRPRAARLYDLLLPYAERIVVTGRAVVCAGSVAHSLGILAALCGRTEEATRHFEQALAMNERLGTRPFAAYTRHAYAAMLLANRDPVVRARALALLAAAHATATELGMGLLLPRIEALEVDLPAPSPTAGAAPPLPATQEQAIFRREGRTWTIVYDGTTCRVKDANGLRFVARLLRHPGLELHALDLVAEAAGDGGDPPLRHALGDAGELLDRQACTAYRQRLDDLRQRLAEAKAAGAEEAGTRLEDEIEFLTRELSRAVGLGNRVRRAGSAAERARLNVTRAIKAAEQTLAGLNSSLGRHLRTTIRTGTFCVYRPDPARSVAWLL
jgi:tetratricopeptide (TPR) repeat protein